MGAIRKKLNNRSGASLMFALLFFLMVLMFGAIMLTASNANAGRLATAPETQQTYLNLSSAAKLTRSVLEQATYSYTKVETVTIHMPSGQVRGQTSNPPVSKTNLNLSGLDSQLSTSLEKLLVDNTNAETIRFTIDPGSSIDGLGPVTAEAKFTKDGSLTPSGTATTAAATGTVTVELKDETGHAMKLTLNASYHCEIKTEEGTEYSDKGNPGKGNTYRDDTITTAYTASFSDGIITKEDD